MKGRREGRDRKKGEEGKERCCEGKKEIEGERRKTGVEISGMAKMLTYVSLSAELDYCVQCASR